MKIFIIILAILSSCMASDILWEHFTSTTFPPSGWTVTTTGTGGSYVWSNTLPLDGGFAHGVVNLLSPGSGSATIKTYQFGLTAGDICQICLSIRATTIGIPPASESWQVILFNNGTEIATADFDATPDYPTWLGTCVAFQNISSTSSNYAVGWKVSSSLSTAGPSQVIYDLDDIHVAEIGTLVEPASLGRIKGFFH